MKEKIGYPITLGEYEKIKKRNKQRIKTYSISRGNNSLYIKQKKNK